jgi:hypothetical protein
VTERLTTKRIAAWGLGALIAGGCATRHDDDWLAELRMREATARPLQEIGSTDGAFASRVPAAVRGRIEAGEEADYVALDIGGETPVECALYHDEVESASTVQTLAAQVFAGLETRHGAKIERAPAEIDAGVIAGSPFLRASWTYRTAGDGAEVVGQLKQMIATREGRSVYCVHHENGYAKSFEQVFRDLISNMRFSSYDDLRPYFTQIDVLSANGERFGFATVSLTLEEDGEPRVVRYTTQLARTPEGSLTARDVTVVEHSTLQGGVRGQIFTDYRDGEVASSLVLEDLAGVGWQVRGQRGGGNLRAIFEQPSLSSWLGDARTLGGLVSAGDEQSHARTRVWVPDIEAEASVERRFVRVAQLREQLWEVSSLTGDRSASLAVDGDGLVHATKAVEDERAVLRERVFVEGALR